MKNPPNLKTIDGIIYMMRYTRLCVVYFRAHIESEAHIKDVRLCFIGSWGDTVTRGTRRSGTPW